MRIDIIGSGLSPESLTQAGHDAIAAAGVVIGSPRLLASLAPTGSEQVAASRPADVIAALETTSTSQAAVLMSGDVGFHSGASKVAAWVRQFRPDAELRLIPGVSSVAALAARVGLPWQDACLVSCHASTTDLVSPVRRHHRTIALTGGNVPTLAAGLTQAGYGGLTVWAGEDLGLTTEALTQTTVAQLGDRSWSSLTSLLIENPDADERVRAGLPDDCFQRGSVPMTKSAIRAISLARLAPRQTDICFDIGCGTGSVSVELALAAYAGQVFGVDKNPQAVALTRLNCQALHIGNLTAVEGLAPDVLSGWPTPDVAFVGGTSGSMRAIVDALVARNPVVRIVITAIAIESAAAASEALTAAGLTPQITQINVAEGRPAGGLHLLLAHNPVTIVSGGCDG